MFFIALVLSFILKLRFPVNRSVRDIIQRRYGANVLRCFRRLEQADLRCLKLAADLHFLETCETNDLTPKFLNFRLAARHLQSQRSSSSYRRNLLQKEISHKYSTKYSNDTTRSNLLDELRRLTTFLDYNHLINYIKNCNRKKELAYEERHSRKLHRLGLENNFAKLEADKVIFNFSSHPLSLIEKDALSLGLKFCFNPMKLDYVNHFVAFEKLFLSLKSNPIYGGNIDSLNQIRSNIKQLAFNSYYSFKTKISEQHRNFIDTLKKLSTNENLIVTKPDKGNGVVLMDKSIYLQKMHSLLADGTKFLAVSEDWKSCIFRNQDRVYRFVEELFKKKIVGEVERSNLKNSGSRLGILYGSPKVHKKDLPLRPILSTTNSYNYSLSKLLVNMLKPLCNGAYTVKDSFSFAHEIQNFPNNDYVMASFDVVSLFTNIPVEDTFKIIEDKLFGESVTEYNGFPKKLFKRMYDLCCRDNLFIFDNKLFKQVDGAPMGGCVSPSLAEVFMGYNESVWLDNCPLAFKPVLYKRYVDDTFMLFRSKSHIQLFLNYLNNQHSLIKFTHEVERNGEISFLDVKVVKANRGFETGLFRKETFTGLSTKYNSAVPSRYKINLIQCLVSRAYKICSSLSRFNSELEFLKRYFTQNRFPCAVVNSMIFKFSNVVRSTNTPVLTAEKKSLFCAIPFISFRANSQIKKCLREILKTNYPHLKMKLVFVNNFKVGSFFKFKDRPPTSLVSNAVYLFKCGQCSASYIGETSRHLITRVCDHKGISSRTGKPLSTPTSSRIRDHSIDNNHQILQDDFKILKTCKTIDLKITESILIHKRRPCLNSQDSSVPLYILG